MKEFTVSRAQAGQRAIKFCMKILPGAQISFLHKMMRKKNITRNGKKLDGNAVLDAGDCIRFFFSDETFAKFAGGAKGLVTEETAMNAAVAKETAMNVTVEKAAVTQEIAVKAAATQATAVQTAAMKTTATKTSAAKVVAGELRFAKAGLQNSRIIYEDEDILLYNKPSGMLSQKAKPADISLNEYFLQYLLDTNQLSAEELAVLKPSVCNRLDRNTSGIVICGKSYRGLSCISEMLKKRTLRKFYRCIVAGRVAQPILVNGYLKKDETRNTVEISRRPLADASYVETEIIPLKTGNAFSLLEIHLITGKTHQIRAHLAYLGHPIIGDYKYGKKEINERLKQRYGLRHQLLHAYRLEFPDEMEEGLKQLSGKVMTAPEPDLFLVLQSKLLR